MELSFHRRRNVADRRQTRSAWAFEPGPSPALDVTGGHVRFPVARIWCVGRNYAAHAREMEGGPPDRLSPDPPFFFVKPSTALVAGGGSVRYPPATSLLHHEVELVVALSGGGRDIPSDRALDQVFGYAVGVDLTRRDVQAEAKRVGRPWSMAKGFDGSAPCSAIARSDMIGHPVRGRITATVNGSLRQDGDLSEQIWNVEQVVAHLSEIVELLPGDLLFTGTPAGVGPLVPGDLLDAAIEGVGQLSVQITPSG